MEGEWAGEDPLRVASSGTIMETCCGMLDAPFPPAAPRAGLGILERPDEMLRRRAAPPSVGELWPEEPCWYASAPVTLMGDSDLGFPTGLLRRLLNWGCGICRVILACPEPCCSCSKHMSVHSWYSDKAR